MDNGVNQHQEKDVFNVICVLCFQTNLGIYTITFWVECFLYFSSHCDVMKPELLLPHFFSAFAKLWDVNSCTQIFLDIQRL